MWYKIARFLLRYRILVLVLLTLATSFMAFKATEIQLSYENSQLIPETDEDYIAYEKFKNTFGIDGNIMVVGVESDDIFHLEFFNDWYKLSEKIKRNPEVRSVVSLANLHQFVRVDSIKQFRLLPIAPELPSSQSELDSLENIYINAKFFDHLILNPEKNATLMAISFDNEVLNSKRRIAAVAAVEKQVEAFAISHDLNVFYSGLPYVRTVFATKINKELQKFSILAVLVTAFVLFLFFRALPSVLLPVLVVLIGAIWSVGTIVLLGFKVTLLTSLIPPLIVVIGIPNCVYLINKYHDEFRKHGNQARALTRVVEKIGVATLITNTTTAVGFGVFFFTHSKILVEFGIVASINIMLVFLVSLVLIPIMLSFLPAPNQKQTKHLENDFLRKLVSSFEYLVIHKRSLVFIATGLVILFAGLGLSKLRAIGFIVDDIPKNEKVYTDLKYFEETYNGVMPLEILIDTKRKGGATAFENLQIADQIQDLFSQSNTFSKPISLVEVLKAATQGYFNNNPDFYRLPTNREKPFVLNYLAGANENDSMMRSLVDENKQILRLSFKMRDIGTAEMANLLDTLQHQIKTIVADNDVKVQLTGNSLVFLKGNAYLIHSLITSLLLAFGIIAAIIGIQFKHVRIIFISFIPNFLPLLVTAGIMGYFDIYLKPSTVLIFSIAFGISVDDSIHFLTKYRQELERHNWDVSKTITVALKETGYSMIYTSIILFFGFIIFAFSSFGGTISLGILTSLTLAIAMLANLILLPALLIQFDKKPKNPFLFRKKSPTNHALSRI